MELTALAGNRQIKQQLAGREGARGLGHAYILAGPAGSGRHTLARLLSQALVCSAAPGGERPCGRCPACKKATAGIHPDIAVIAGAEGKAISVDQIRALRADAHIRPNEAPRKVYLLERAGRMNPSAQNAMLKLLEEGPAYAVFLLFTENAGALLPTIRSRCETLSLAPLSPAECEAWLAARFPQKSAAEVHQAALDCQGVLGRAVDRLSGAQDGERQALCAQLAAGLERGGELELFQTAMALDKLGREDLQAVLDGTVEEIGRLLPASSEKRRLLKAAELLRTLRGAAELNVGGGQLGGWLCAAMFTD